MIVRSRAPLRLGLAGGGTDVSPFSDQHGGFVMNVTIDKFAYATVSDARSDLAEFEAQDAGHADRMDPARVDLAPGPTQLMRGVYLRVCQQFLGGKRPALRVRAHSDAPPGSGLGSSSTMVVTLVAAFNEYFGLALGEYEIAHLAYEIERKDLGLSGGKQDQYAAAFGGFNFMEFYAGDRVIVNPLRIKDWVWCELEASLVLYFTGVSRASAAIIDEQSRNVREGRTQSLEAMHRLKLEAVQMKESLLRGDLARFAEVMQSGWEAKKKMASSITNPMIDQIEALAFANGARAAKVSGAGGGGFMMFVCDPSERVRLVRALSGAGGTVYDTHFTPYGATSWKIG
ncbi:GHMP family kinase ATP-binding protein [Tepidiphilus thermophilus]|mgnify:CR=1 FL=1|jgi:Predicted kinase related to galactokinase and mevalonate kinase|uniref:Predicted kinase related to galactokinase and mevalonate kinase n=1 Tax=Tepidiphilus thermophilus TaxID=876478 RepID=A0A0K6IYL5_9PROT|nr:dehydrogenase [Tepidiphilus thermophilus]MBO2467779.1 dehydrogenase [Xanthomonadaceae bacterium]MBO2512206.1 dehydrogenase [Gammaproteobacteria bacterium]CUB08178.1 Predicted kinase related to galactokinase and mevalonate kinase [Tepidiphilus thermophilus]